MSVSFRGTYHGKRNIIIGGVNQSAVGRDSTRNDSSRDLDEIKREINEESRNKPKRKKKKKHSKKRRKYSGRVSRESLEGKSVKDLKQLIVDKVELMETELREKDDLIDCLKQELSLSKKREAAGRRIRDRVMEANGRLKQEIKKLRQMIHQQEDQDDDDEEDDDVDMA